MCIPVNIAPDKSLLDKKWFVMAYVVICAEGGEFVARADAPVFADRIVEEHNSKLEETKVA